MFYLDVIFVCGLRKSKSNLWLIMYFYVKFTSQSFWCVYNNIPTPSRVACRYSYHLMRDTRRPIWEDKENVNGGYWKLKCPKFHTVRESYIT